MAMEYAATAIPETSVPKADAPIFQHLLEIYAGETCKVASVWSCFSPADLSYRIHPKSSTVEDVLKHQLLSERRFFGEFLGAPEPAPGDVLPHEATPEGFRGRLVDLAGARLGFLASRTQAWWLERVPFFDVTRERIWIFWRRVLHTAHHRTQLTVYLRMLGRPVPPIYGPTADITWKSADPTRDAGSAGRR
jgi:uncharacterized damage-inducible protein DinB